MDSKPPSSEIQDTENSGSDILKDRLRRIFDTQIPNYGDYNLLIAVNKGSEADGASAPSHFVLGYRWKPVEIMIAPVNATLLTPTGVPVEINMTNLSHALQLTDADYEVGTSTGRVFAFGVRPAPEIGLASGQRLILDQRDDFPDFQSFMKAFIKIA